MDKISTSELITKIVGSTGVNATATKAVIRDLAAQINGHVENGTAVAVAGLGKFYPMEKKEKEIPAKRVLSFKASKKA